MDGRKLFLAFDIGGTKSAALLGTAWGQVLAREEFPSLAQRGPHPMIDDLCAAARRLLSQLHAVPLAIGVSIGGPLDAEQGVIQSPPNLPGWDQVPLKALLQERFGVHVCVEHDAAACALAEYRWGAGRGARRLVYLTCATGFGAGLIIDGQIYRGAAGLNCEIGHLRYRDDGPEAFGKTGSLEAFCSATALSRLAAWRFPQRWTACPPTPRQIADLWTAGDPDAAAVVAINARAVGDVCAMLADTWRPDVILLGSLARYLGAPWVEQVRARWRSESLPASLAAGRILPASLGSRLQDCSALVVATEAPAEP